MRPLHRIFSLLTLLGWLFAAAHVALQHDGVADGGAHHMHLGDVDDDHDDDGPAHDGDHHHHDLSAMSAAHWVKSAEQKAITPVWVPLVDALNVWLAEMLREGREPLLLRTCEHAPPDERDFGWLLVCQTAHPARGPSLVA